MKFFCIFLFASISGAWAQTSYVAPTKTLQSKAYQLGFAGDYFNSSKRIDKDGKETSFTDGEKFSRLQGEVTGFYGLTDQFQIGGGVRFRQNASTMMNSSNEEETDTSTGVQSTFVNLMYAFKPVDRLRYVIEGSFRYMPYTNEESTGSDVGSLILGDDGSEYSGGVGVTYASKTNNFLTLRTGLRSPGRDLSSEIYWQVEGALAWRYVALVAGVDGVSSMNNDPHEDEPANKPNYNRGVSELYNSTNREWIAPYAGINLALGKNWRMEFKGSQVVSGRSTDLGTSFGIALIRRVDESKKTQRADTKFKEYDIEATITKVSPKQGYVVIDKGVSDDVQKGMKIDFYEFDYVGGNVLLARGTVIQTKASTAIVKITQTYNTKKALKEGVIARGSLR